MLSFTAYQQRARETAVYPDQHKLQGIMYSALGLAGEAGEVANKVKKIARDHGGKVSPDLRQAIGKEIGDVLWYCANLCTDLGLSLSISAEDNLAALADRKNRGVIQGSGDNR